MKKTYEPPSVEVVKFQYRDQVVVASSCQDVWIHTGVGSCTDGNSHLESLK